MRNPLITSLHAVLPVLLFTTAAISLHADTLGFSVDSSASPFGTLHYDGGLNPVIGSGFAIASIFGDTNSSDCPDCTLQFQSGAFLGSAPLISGPGTEWDFGTTGSSFAIMDPSMNPLVSGVFLPTLSYAATAGTGIMVMSFPCQDGACWYLVADATVTSEDPAIQTLANLSAGNSGDFPSIFGLDGILLVGSTSLTSSSGGGNSGLGDSCEPGDDGCTPSFQSAGASSGLGVFTDAAVPEPSTFPLFGSAFLSMAVLGARLRRR